MKVSLVVGVCCLSLVAASFFPSLSSPVVFWSGRGHFSNGQTLESVYTGQVDKTLASLCGSTQTEGTLTAALGSEIQSPELVVLWLEPQLQTSTLSERVGAYATKNDYQSALKSVLNAATTSFVVPYTYGLADTVTFDNTIAHISSEGGRVVYAGESERLSTEDLKDFLQSNREMLSNGKVDLLVVRAGGDRIANAIEDIERLVRAGSAGNYVSLYGAEHVSSVASEETIRGPYPYKKYWPRSLWEGLFVTVGLGFMLVIGIAMITVIKIPPRFETELQLLKPEALRER